MKLLSDRLDYNADQHKAPLHWPVHQIPNPFSYQVITGFTSDYLPPVTLYMENLKNHTL